MSAQLREGYKQTDVGLLPNDWHVKPLHAVAERIMVGIASAATHAYRDKGVVMFRNQNIKAGGLDDSDVLHIAEDYEEAFRNKRLKAGDLLTARTGYPGTTCVVPAQYEGAQSFTTLITRPNRRLVDSGYLCCFVNSTEGQTYFEQTQIGGGQKNVNAGSLKWLPVPLPSTRAEQEAIALALSDTDALIESLAQLIAKKRDIKQGAMQKLLRPKDGWVSKTLSQIADIRSGGTPSTNRAEYWDGDVPWCTPTDITALKGQKYLTATSRTITSQGLKASSAEIIPAQSVVMTSRATIGECAINRVPLATNQGFKNFVPLQGTNAEFLYYLLLTKKQDFVGLCSGSTFLEIGKTQLVGFEVVFPLLV